MTPRLTLSQLTKRFGAVHALTDVSLDVAPGERVALLGHNGAGKSTLMKIVLGLIGFDSGTVSIEGLEWQEVDFPQDVEAADALTAKWVAEGRYAK